MVSGTRQNQELGMNQAISASTVKKINNNTFFFYVIQGTLIEEKVI